MSTNFLKNKKNSNNLLSINDQNEKEKIVKKYYTNTDTKSLARKKELYEAYESLENQKKFFLE